MSESSIRARCPICDDVRSFVSPDQHGAFRARMTTPDCPQRVCIPRHRALGEALFTLYPRNTVPGLAIHESSPGPNGLSLWLRTNCPSYVGTGYFPDHPPGELVGHLRNEDLAQQTFGDACFDLVLHLDVMEHVFEPFRALQEIERTLKPGGRCLFTTPTYPERVHSRQVAFLEHGELRIEGTPEYHGNPQNKGGSLVTWRYGYDLPQLICAHTGFDVEVRRWCAPSRAIMGPMTEVYILTKAPEGDLPAPGDATGEHAA